MRQMIVPLLAGLALGACQPKSESTASSGPPSSGGLAGTSWRLVEIQSMDDAQGKSRPDDPAKYTLSFGADGRLAARLDCNRGNGPWQSESAGSLRIGPLAVTRALCPPPSLGGRLARDLDYVRTYTLRNGRLYLSLMADGGIIVLEPTVAE